MEIWRAVERLRATKNKRYFIKQKRGADCSAPLVIYLILQKSHGQGFFCISQ
jgi:hypothetical protein